MVSSHHSVKDGKNPYKKILSILGFYQGTVNATIVLDMAAESQKSAQHIP
jgi:hypothetical protein